jgi:flagellin-like hook-associated protein FlgL
MADSYNMQNLAEYSLNLLRDQMIFQLMSGGLKGLSLTDLILGRRPQRSGTDIMNDALSGLRRSDAAMLRQAAKNMAQGTALLETGKEALENISGKVSRMRELVEDLKSDLGNPALEAEYLSLAGDIKASVQGTSFNGLRLLDGENWDYDERIKTNGDTGKLSLQAGNSPTELTLFDLQAYKNKFTASDFADTAALTQAGTDLEAFSGLLAGMRESYAARAGLLASEGASMTRSADIMDEARNTAGSDDLESLRRAVINILMREQGALLDESS